MSDIRKYPATYHRDPYFNMRCFNDRWGDNWRMRLAVAREPEKFHAYAGSGTQVWIAGRAYETMADRAWSEKNGASDE